VMIINRLWYAREVVRLANEFLYQPVHVQIGSTAQGRRERGASHSFPLSLNLDFF
jgi:hypothetical protein